MLPTFFFEQAQEKDLYALNDLLYASKAHWPYPEAFLFLFMRNMRLDETYLRTSWTEAIFTPGPHGPMPIAFYSLSRDETEPDCLSLDHFFVHPTHMGHGLGREMWARSLMKTQERAARALILTSDPFAEDFYVKMGCVEEGSVPSPLAPERFLKLYRYVIKGNSKG